MPSIERVDPFDDAAVRSWYRVWRAGAAEGRDRPGLAAFPELRAALRDTGSEEPREAWVAKECGEAVGALMVGLVGRSGGVSGPTGAAEVEVSVPAEHRRRGHGSALLAHADKVAADSGRTTLLAEAHVPLSGGAEAHPGVRFAAAHGFRGVHREDRLVLELPADPTAVARTAGERAPLRAGYRVDAWSGPCPDGQAAALAMMRTATDRTVPGTEPGLEPRAWDEATVRAVEERMARRRVTAITALARTAEGAAVAFSELFVPEHSVTDVYQGGTLVLDAHRGRGLGAALKAVNLARLWVDHPQRRRVHTWTARGNTPMQHINRGFGFQPVEVDHRLCRGPERG
ncbi:GNAT family N-acetyltransferase [Nocardiopsis coralliicola]